MKAIFNVFFKRLPRPLQNGYRRLRSAAVTPLYRRLPLPVPLSLHIDPSNLCNFKCAFCPTGDPALLRSVNRFNGVMRLDLFRKIIDDCEAMTRKAGKRIDMLHLYKDGEPFLNKDFIAMAACAKQKNVARVVSTTTNGSLLTKELSSAIVRTGIDAIRISVEQVSDEGYAKITNTFSDFETIKSNIAALWAEKKRHKGRLRVAVKINDAGLTKEELRRFTREFTPLCDELKIDALMGWSSSKKKDFTLGHTVKTAMDGVTPLTEKTVCPEPFRALAINADGRVSVCCVDWACETIVGDCTKQRLQEIWNGRELREFRAAHYSGERGKLPACAACHYLRGFGQPLNLDAHARELAALYRG